MAAVFGFSFWTQDVSQAFLQKEDPLISDVYVQPKEGIKLITGQMLKLSEPFYHLTDSEDYWDFKIKSHLKCGLRMEPLTGDLSCFVKFYLGKLHRMIDVHVGNFIGIENDCFVQRSHLTSRHFESKGKIYHNTTFAGIAI